MQNFEKPLQDFTEDELQQRINQWDPRFGALALYELQRRQQKLNTEQISTLIKEIRKLKNIADENAETAHQTAKSSNRLAKTAITIAVVSLISQGLFSTHQEIRCAFRQQSSNDPFLYHTGCFRYFDFGLLGKYSIKIPDYK